MSWLDDLRLQLQREGISSTEINALIAEVSDHLEDLEKEKGMDANLAQQTMGDVRQIARLAAIEYRKRSRFYKRPVLWLLVVPTLTAIIFYLPLVVAVAYVGAWAGQLVESVWPEWNVTSLNMNGLQFEIISAWMIAMFCIPNLIMTTLWCSLARKFNGKASWILLTSFVLAILSSVVLAGHVIDHRAHGQLSAVTINLGWFAALLNLDNMTFGSLLETRFVLESLVQFALPMMIGVWFACSRRSDDNLSGHGGESASQSNWSLA